MPYTKMTHYSVQPRDQIFVKVMDFCLLLEIQGKNVGKTLSSKYSQKLLDHAKQPGTYALKTASKSAIKKTEKAIGDLIGNKIADRIKKVSKLHHRIIQKQMKRKYLEKDTYLQKKDRKLLMI